MRTGNSENLLYLVAKGYADRALKYDLNAMIAITGEMGSGKSSLALRIAEILRDEHGLHFGPENIYFDLYKFADDLKANKKHVFVVDEAGVQLYARNFMTDMNRFIAQIAQMLRFRNSVIIFTLPHVKFLDKTVRILLQHIWRTKVVFEPDKVRRVAKPYIASTDYVHDRIEIKPAKYRTRYGGHNEFPWIEWSLPSRELWDTYNEMKERFFSAIVTEKSVTMSAKKKVSSREVLEKLLKDKTLREILLSDTYNRRRSKILKEVADKYGFTKATLYYTLKQIKEELKNKKSSKEPRT